MMHNISQLLGEYLTRYYSYELYIILLLAWDQKLLVADSNSSLTTSKDPFFISYLPTLWAHPLLQNTQPS